MDLKSVFSRVIGEPSGSALRERYLAVKISSTEVLATVWSITEGQVVVENTGGEKIGGVGYDGLLQAADGAVSTALGETRLPAAKTIFGVSPDWISEGKIVPEKLQLLRKICKELDLRPLGYVQLFEALENYLKETEGAPLTAILIGLDGDSGWVTLLRAGKNLGTVPLPEEKENFADRISVALHRFTQIDVLPARIILYDGRRDLKALEEKIMAHPWTKSLPFLHFPRVEVLSGDLIVKAVAIAGGTQMGGKIDTKEEMIEEKKLEELTDDRETEEGVEPELEEVSALEAGFVTDGELGKLQEMQQGTNPTEMPARIPMELPKINLKEAMSGVLPMFSKITAKLKSLRTVKNAPAIHAPSFSSKKPQPIAFVAIAVLIAILSLGGAIVYFVPKARILVHLAPKTFDREMEATISGQFIEVSEIGSKKSVASGKKMVGEKAKGTVTIGNPSDGRTFPAGTILTSVSGLKFSLNSDVQMASGAGVLALATTTAPVTAADIGDNYNLAADTLFSIANFSGQAKNGSAFSGGNSHEANVVTKTDQDRLFATLSAELTQKAQTDLNAKLVGGQTLLPNAITSEVAKKRFSKDVDNEADNFTLDLTLNFKGVTASQNDLTDKFLERFGSDVPAGFALSRETAKPEIKSTKLDKSGNAVLSVRLNAAMLPQLDLPELTKSVAGKSAASAKEIILKQTGVNSVEIEVAPKFFGSIIDRFLPWRTGNIKLETVSD